MLQETCDDRGVMRITLDRPEKRNAFDDAVIAALTDAFARASRDTRVRAVVLAGQGGHFCAGADLDWMRRMADYGFAENEQDARQLAAMLGTIDTMPKPVVARAKGAAFGGGAGLLACCDIVVAEQGAKFCFSEVRLGLTPATISPFVVRAIGPRQARRYFQTAEVFSASEAREIGLVHTVVPEAELDPAVDRVVAALLQGGPEAQREAKALVPLAFTAPPADLTAETARRIAERRASAEGREGIGAFLERRKPGWSHA